MFDETKVGLSADFLIFSFLYWSCSSAGVLNMCSAFLLSHPAMKVLSKTMNVQNSYIQKWKIHRGKEHVKAVQKASIKYAT